MRTSKAVKAIHAETTMRGLTLAGLSYTMTVSGDVNTLDDGEIHEARNWRVVSWYAGVLTLQIDGKDVVTRLLPDSTVEFTITGW